jgi:hypothetical protein
MTMTGVAFVMPDHPGPVSIHLAAATTAQITETNRQFFVNLAKFNLAAKLHTALKALFIAVIDDVYIAELCDETMQNTKNVTVRDLLAHLTTTYGAITFTQLDLNLAQLDVEFNPPDEPMEALWKSVKECR